LFTSKKFKRATIGDDEIEIINGPIKERGTTPGKS
jgi:hypothetical protein